MGNDSIVVFTVKVVILVSNANGRANICLFNMFAFSSGKALSRISVDLVWSEKLYSKPTMQFTEISDLKSIYLPYPILGE